MDISSVSILLRSVNDSIYIVQVQGASRSGTPVHSSPTHPDTTPYTPRSYLDTQQHPYGTFLGPQSAVGLSWAHSNTTFHTPSSTSSPLVPWTPIPLTPTPWPVYIGYGAQYLPLRHESWSLNSAGLDGPFEPEDKSIRDLYEEQIVKGMLDNIPLPDLPPTARSRWHSRITEQQRLLLVLRCINNCGFDHLGDFLVTLFAPPVDEEALDPVTQTVSAFLQKRTYAGTHPIDVIKLMYCPPKAEKYDRAGQPIHGRNGGPATTRLAPPLS